MTIQKKEFYFIRHGETDANAHQIAHDVGDIPLNPTGKIQAKSVQKKIETLPIQTICVSPLLRAIETKEIVAQNLSCPVVVVQELEECSGSIWLQMTENEEHDSEEVQSFMQRTLLAINRAISHPGPVLIVAHGGIHWAMTHAMAIKKYEKKIGNCVPVHFYLSENFEWQAKYI